MSETKLVTVYWKETCYYKATVEVDVKASDGDAFTEARHDGGDCYDHDDISVLEVEHHEALA